MVPNKWKEADISPVFKTGKKTDPSNYRPISLTSVPCKIMERLSKKVMMKHLIKNSLITKEQHGFINFKSCVTNLIETLDFLSETLNRGFLAILIYLDFAKAFDKGDHVGLHIKLERIGFRGAILCWLKAFLTDRKQMVKIQKVNSSWNEVLSGVPQGSVLGPVLFIIFINDMPEIVKNICKLFADDSKIMAQIKNTNDLLSVQDDLDGLVEWSRSWNMSFNNSKCKTMFVGNGKGLNKIDNAKTFIFKMEDLKTGIQIPLSETKVERDLGILISNDLKWSAQAKKASNKANSVLAQLKRTIIRWDAHTLKTLYTGFVRPHLEYAVSAWNPFRRKDINILEKVQRRATKLVPELRNLPYEVGLEKLDLTSLSDRRVRGDAIQFYKILNGFNNLEWYQPNISNHQLKLPGPAGHTRGFNHRLHRQFTGNCVSRENFLSNRIIPVWNKLPSKVVLAKSINGFKNEYDKFFALNNKKTLK